MILGLTLRRETAIIVVVKIKHFTQLWYMRLEIPNNPLNFFIFLQLKHILPDIKGIKFFFLNKNPPQLILNQYTMYFWQNIQMHIYNRIIANNSIILLHRPHLLLRPLIMPLILSQPHKIWHLHTNDILNLRKIRSLEGFWVTGGLRELTLEVQDHALLG